MKQIDSYIQEKLYVGKGYQSKRSQRPDGEGPKYDFLDALETVGAVYVIDKDLDYMLKIGLEIDYTTDNKVEIPWIFLNIKDDDYFKNFEKEAAFDELYLYHMSSSGVIKKKITTRYQFGTGKTFDVDINGFKYTKNNAELIYKALKDYENYK